MDFVHDQLATGRKLRMLTIVDTFSRFSPAVEQRFNFRGADVVEILEEVATSGVPGAAACLRCANSATPRFGVNLLIGSTRCSGSPAHPKGLR
jgi:hypothetical protein